MRLYASGTSYSMTIDPQSFKDHWEKQLLDRDGEPHGTLSHGEYHHAEVARALYEHAWRLEAAQLRIIKEWIDDYMALEGRLLRPK